MSNHRDHPDLRGLLALAAVGREGSFNKAANYLGHTQSAISQQIHHLEQITGHKVIERPGGSRPISLTAAGDMLLKHANAIIDRLDTARADLKALADGESGTLRVGCYQSVGGRFLPHVLRRFAAAWPGITVELKEAEDDFELLQLVQDGELDLTFIAYPLPDGPFAHRELFEDPYVLVVPKDSDIGLDGAGVDPTSLDQYSIVTYGQMREAHSIERRLGQPGLTRNIAFRSNNNEMIVGLVSAGVGVGVISWLSVNPFRTDVRVVPLVRTQPRLIGLAWHVERMRIPALDAFVEIAQEELRRIPRPTAWSSRSDSL